MAGAAIYEIQKAGFEIAAIQALSFSKPNAEEFLEVYKGVVQEYSVRIVKKSSISYWNLCNWRFYYFILRKWLKNCLVECRLQLKSKDKMLMLLLEISVDHMIRLEVFFFIVDFRYNDMII